LLTYIEDEERDGSYLTYLLFPAEGGKPIPTEEDLGDSDDSAATEEVVYTPDPESVATGAVAKVALGSTSVERSVTRLVQNLDKCMPLLISTLNDAVDRFDGMVKALTARQGALEAKVGSSNKHVDDLDARQQELTKQVQASLAKSHAGEDYEKILQMLSELAKAVADHGANTLKRVDTINKASLRDQLQSIQSRMDANAIQDKFTLDLVVEAVTELESSIRD
jgi:hypothetical protein